ncbi:glycine betaine/proline transport system substrate-binding protein [Geomicrobium halophilum]|uniref:Glycine betaine/proline transport system substrate-binding protein n=1 Tax=Geomicrobium halophilum TaxID=549000 RepID=A0A841PS36_9BACL|nr:glycine betaine ABC transporter substrate-binding protein [Geomicrobium halophilum]MBB6449986.1 glycine betaine/proline transport system substrate-binding protein [Geomicrobium halophilum]
MTKNNVMIGFVSIGLMSGLTACSESSGDESADANSEESIGEQVDYEIIGIDPGSVMMTDIEDALNHYDLDEWDLVSSSEGAMVQELDQAVENEEPVIVAGWEPHWKFTSYNLKFLEDPDEISTAENDVHTLVRNGLSEDLPGPYQLFDQFQFELEEQQQVMELMELEGMEAEDAAREWLGEHPERVEEWTEGVDEGNGEEVELILENWADAEAATNMVRVMLQDLGYEPTLNEVTINAMYAGLASDSADAMFASWLPNQQPIYDEYDGEFEDLGPNSTETQTGIVVPEYMDIDSIEDLHEEDES